MVGADVSPGVTVEDKSRALQDVLGSETFFRSERLKGLLRFLCEAEIEAREGDLNEYTIATAALGRPSGFSPLEDSSVRSRVHELRQRLEKYYAQEGASATVRIELRKGTYVPRFHRTEATREAHSEVAAPDAVPERLVPAAPLVQPAVEPAPDAPARANPARLMSVLSFAAGAAVMLAIVVAFSLLPKPGAKVPATHLQTAAEPVWTRDLEAFWHPFLANGTPLLIAYETRFFVRMGQLELRDWRINAPEMAPQSEPLSRARHLFGFLRYDNRNYTDGGTPQAVFNLVRLLSSRIPNMSLKNSLDLTAADLRDNNVILLGKPGMDPEVERILSRGELLNGEDKIVNVHPAAGEQAEYLNPVRPLRPQPMEPEILGDHDDARRGPWQKNARPYGQRIGAASLACVLCYQPGYDY